MGISDCFMQFVYLHACIISWIREQVVVVLERNVPRRGSAVVLVRGQEHQRSLHYTSGTMGQLYQIVPQCTMGHDQKGGFLYSVQSQKGGIWP